MKSLKLLAVFLYAVGILFVSAKAVAEESETKPVYWILTKATEEAPPQILPVYNCGTEGTCDHLNQQDEQRTYLYPDGVNGSGPTFQIWSISYVNFGGMCFPSGYVPPIIRDGFGWN